MSDIKIVLIYSLAYSGTSWTTMVLGSDEAVINLGGGDRLIKEGPGAPQAMCLVHQNAGQCDYWPGFFKGYTPKENFFVQLAEYTGVGNFVLNNPSIQLFDREFVNNNLDVRVIKQIRDGRAALASAMRHHPHRVQNVYQSAFAWLYRGTKNLERRVENTGNRALLLRYEDAVDNPLGMLQLVSEHTGIAYTADSLRYWEYDHHLTGANQGALDILMRLQGQEGFQHKRRDYYDELLEHIKNTQGVPKLDESWRGVYDAVDIAAYDYVAGELYEGYGYERPSVEDWAREEFQRRYAPPATLGEALDKIPPWRLSDAEEKAAQRGERADKLLKRIKSRLVQWSRR